MRVLDACASPGGKSFAAAILMHNQGSILSCDIHEKKLTLPACLEAVADLNDDLKSDILKYVSSMFIPEKYKILSEAETSLVLVTIQEGKFHQIKRMFHAVGKEVLSLMRTGMGTLSLDPSLLTGEYRPLTEEEIQELKGNQ